MKLTDCRHFNGYKPCPKNSPCSDSCPFLDSIQTRILLVHLGAMGAVLRSTSLLPAIKRKFPKSHITWITEVSATPLLLHNPMIDKVVGLGWRSLLELKAQQFDVGLCIDKAVDAVGIMEELNVPLVFGFKTTANGAIQPATKAAHELWQLGLDNQKKFFENTKTEQELVHTALELGLFCRDEYVLQLDQEELHVAQNRKRQWSQGVGPLIGLNIGCSPMLPEKKLSVALMRNLICLLKEQRFCNLVLLGGPTDKERSLAIAEGMDIAMSPLDLGLRDGMSSVQACDLVISGDSLGMHMAIALKKKVIAWFGPSCSQEIDLYDRGKKVVSEFACSPCWNRHCQKPIKCNEAADIFQIVQLVTSLTMKESQYVISAQQKNDGISY